MKNVIETLSNNKKYDYVIIDTPPILGLSDSNLISEYCDLMILLVYSKIDRDTKEAISRIRKFGSSQVGYITNSIKMKR